MRTLCRTAAIVAAAAGIASGCSQRADPAGLSPGESALVDLYVQLAVLERQHAERPDSVAAVLDSVRRCAAVQPDRPWIKGRGWQLPVFPGGNPRREWLDSVVPDRPVYLVAADGHSAWVNSRALAAAGVSRSTADPVNGRIERDPSGAPSGTLRESATRRPKVKSR